MCIQRGRNCHRRLSTGWCHSTPHNLHSISTISTQPRIFASAIFSNLRLFLTLIDEGRIVMLPDGKMASDSLDLLLATTDWPSFDIELTRQLRRPLDQENLVPRLSDRSREVLQFVEVADGRIKVH